MNQQLFDIKPNPIEIYHIDSLDLLDVNEAFIDKYGYKQEEIAGLSLFDLRPDDAEKELEKVLADREAGKDYRTGVVKHCSEEGVLFYVMVSCRPYQQNGKQCRMAFIHDVTERVKAEQRAQQAYNELNHHVNNSPLAMVKWNSQFQIVEWSKRAEELTGYSKELVLGKTPNVFSFTGDDLSVAKKNMEYLISGKQDKTKFEVTLNARDDIPIDLRIHASVLRAEDNSLISVRTFIEDITEEKKAELRYQRLFENANDGIFLMKNTKFVECNAEVLNIYGCNKREEILGKTPIEFSPEFQPDGKKSSEKAREKISMALDGSPQVFEWKHLQLDGTPIDVEVSLNRLLLGNEEYIQAIVRDLTDQKKAQEKLRKSEELFRKLFLKAPGAMVMIDPQNRVKMVNNSFEELFGYSESELINRDIDEIIVDSDDDQIIPRMPDEGFDEDKFYSDIVRYTKKGEKIDIMLGALPVRLDGELIAGFGIYIDVSEQKKYERKLQQSLKEKKVLLEEVHHRVKNNLAIISGLLQLQAFEMEDKKIAEALNDSQLRIQSMALVHEMLYQSENFIDISFESYLGKLINTMRETLPFDHQHIEVEIETEEVTMDINQAIPSAILVNELVTNSYKHAFEGIESGKIKINLYEEDQQIIIIVRDNGIGLPEDFSITEESSIGMNLIESLTEQLEGTLKIENRQGSYFEIRFNKVIQRGSSTLHLLNEEKK